MEKDDDEVSNAQRKKIAKGMLLYKEECYAIQGAIFEVYRVMGSGFLKAMYQECYERELYSSRVLFQSQVPLSLYFNTKMSN